MADKQRISYVPLEDMTPEMRAEMERCAREGTPRPESSAIRAHVPAAFWFFANSWNELFRERDPRSRHQGAVPRLHLALGQVRVLRQPALGEGRASSGLVEGQYDELINFETSDALNERQKAALAYAEAIAWHSTPTTPSGSACTRTSASPSWSSSAA